MNSDELRIKIRNNRRAARASCDKSTIPIYRDRICIDCNTLKPCKWDRNININGTPSYRTRCIECYPKYDKKIRDKRLQKRTERSRISRTILRAKCFEYAGTACTKCGYSGCLSALTFHHIDPSTKLKDVSQMINGRWSWDKIRAEIDKCILLCFNCHMELESKIRANKV